MLCAQPFSTTSGDGRLHRGLLRRPHAGDLWKVRRWLVLVAAQTRLFARGLAYWAVRYQLRALSQCCKCAARRRPTEWIESGQERSSTFVVGVGSGGD